MAELTKQQLHSAAQAGNSVAESLGFPEMALHVSDSERENMLFLALRAAAPYLQLPWDEPTEQEVSSFGTDAKEYKSLSQRFEWQCALAAFVRRRNAALK